MTDPTQTDWEPEFDPEEVHRIAMTLIDAVGPEQALQKARRQERETVLENGAARAVREEVERLCALGDGAA